MSICLLGRAPAAEVAPHALLLPGTGAEPDLTDGGPAAGDLAVHQQAGEAAAAAGP